VPPLGTAPALVQSAGATETAPAPLLTASFPVATVPGHLLVLSASAYTGTSNTSTSANSGGAAASTGELVIGFMAGHATTQAMSVPFIGYTLQPQLTSTGDAVSLLTGYRVAGASGAQSLAGGFPPSMYWAAGVVVFHSAH